MSGATERQGESPDDRSDFDKGFHEGVLSAYREISMWSQARLDRLEPGKSQRMRDDIEHAHVTLLRLLRHRLPQKHYPGVWR